MENSHDKIVEVLKEIFSNVNYWLGFMEAKTIALLALNVGILAMLWNTKQVIIINAIITILVVFSCLFSFGAFIPRLSTDKASKEAKKGTDNLIFYRDIAKYTKEEYVEQICKRYFPNEQINSRERGELMFHYAEEIVTNSKIVLIKKRFFSLSLIADGIALVLFIIMVILAGV